MNDKDISKVVDSVMGTKPVKHPRYFEVFGGADNQYYWRAVARSNKKTTFIGEGHPTAAKARRAIKQECAAMGMVGEPEIVDLVMNVKPAAAPK